jgi:serine/threonine protein kinase
MSPEQASGNRNVIDHRSDIYSLGATLYEMLTRKPVFEGHSRQELLHQIFHDEPIPLRKIDRSIPEELEIITLKALRQSASERYETAQAFAEDLRRYLEENPILARRPSLVDKARKWMRRHPATVLSLLFALVASVVSLAIVTVTVTHQKSLTAQSLIREQLRAVQAEKRLSIAQAAADEMIRMAENELSISPMEEALRQRLLNSAIKYYQSIIDETQDDFATHQNLVVIRDRAKTILSKLESLQESRQLNLLEGPQVQQDLGLTHAQISVISRKGTGSPNAPSQRNGDSELQKQLLHELNLNDSQLRRLKQISVQLQGPPGLRDMVVSGQLQLSSEQLESIQSDIIEFITKTGFLSLLQSHSSSKTNGRTMPDELSGVALESIANILAVDHPQTVRGPEDLITPEIKNALMEVLLKRLTPEQLSRWKEITGEKFEVNPSTLKQ